MTEFEKWWQENYGIGLETIEFKRKTQNSWQAALKWAKAMHDVSSEPRFSFNIQQELESLKNE